MTVTPKKSFWGAGVWLIYSTFVLFVLVLGAIAGTQRFDLVEPNYYERGLAYQNRIDAMSRSQDPAAQPCFTYRSDPRAVTLCFPDLAPRPIAGAVLFFRPSSARQDFSVPFHFDSTSCIDFVDQRLESGYWKLKCDWQDAQGGHYFEQSLFVE